MKNVFSALVMFAVSALSIWSVLNDGKIDPYDIFGIAGAMYCASVGHHELKKSCDQ
jgi:hypothetical protein